MLKSKIEKILKDIKELEKNPSQDNKLPQNTYYLNDEDILCYPRETGESRFPYDSDGLVVWARQTGYIDACESLFTIFKTANFGEDPCINFFSGIKLEDKSSISGCSDSDKENECFFPISILGANCQLFEPFEVKRYVVFSLRCAYYIADTEKATFAVRFHVDKEKHIHFSVIGINKTNEKIEFYLTSFFEALLRFMESEGFWDKMTKYGRRYENGSFVLKSANRGDECLTINSKIIANNITEQYYTTARSEFLGYKGRTLTNAESLKKGKFDKQIGNVGTTDLPIASDMIHFSVESGETARIEYDLIAGHDEEKAIELCKYPIDIKKIEKELEDWRKEEQSELDNIKIEFSNWNSDKVNDKVFNKFIKNVQKQISFCALGKNYAGPHLGIRDVFQQLEGSLIWQPERSREKILVALNYILSDGRPPRQFSIPASPEAAPDLDLRYYIDQGVWIISTIYTYLSYTDDYSILKEKCTYYDLHDDSWVTLSKTVDTALDHILRIVAFLISKIDDKTGCLRAMYGDWNDALDGLGKTEDEGKDYGSGVTVMATLQLYQNLREMTEILNHIGGYEDKIAEYQKVSEKMEKGLFKYAVDHNDSGEKRVIHGWGDKMSYKIGSFNDCDGASRYSLTAHSFWVISGMLEKDPSMKETVMKCMKILDSKYGLRTLTPSFARNTQKYVGRLATITPGTYENDCAYVHASMFGIMALFSMGESKEAWNQIEKSMVITHDNATMTTFVMPNSYCYNPELNIDGVSMGDWYTGSGAVLVKEIIKYGFGILPTLDSLTIQMPKFMPCRSAIITINVKGCKVELNYVNNNTGSRVFKLNGKEVIGEYDRLMDICKLNIKKEQLKDFIRIEITD